MGGLKLTAGLVLAMTALAGGAAQAQSPEMRLLRGPVYGELRDVLGAALPVAQPSPKCPRPALLPDGACLDRIVAAMKARGATSERVLTSPDAAPGALVSGEIGRDYRLYDVSLSAGGGQILFTPLTLPISSVRVPRACYGTGRGVDYRIEPRDQLIAREVQTVSCGGAVPPLGTGGPRLPPIGAAEPGDRWPATATLAVTGAPRQLAPPRPDCPPEAALRDGLCFAAGIAVLTARPDLKELDVIGAKRPVAPGQILVAKDTEQYVLKRKGKGGFKADKRWFDKSNLAGPAGCDLFDAGSFEVEPNDFAHERALAGCGAPGAPPPTALYEAYGATMPVVMGNRPGCAERGEQLLGNACFSEVIGYLKSRRIGKAEVLVLGRPYGPGARVYGGGPVGFSFADVWVNPDGTWKADRKRSYSAQIRSANCATVTGEGSEASGVKLIHADGGVMAQAYQWVACPVR